MLFLLLAIAFLALKYFGIGFVAAWSWWYVLIPLGCAVVWWQWSDASGRSKRLAMEKMEDRRKERVQKHRDALKANYKSRH